LPRNKEKTDLSILNKALKVIIKKGPTAFSLEDISKVVALSPATLLQRFGSKKGLLSRVLEYSNQKMFKELNKRIERTLRSEKSSIESIIELLLDFVGAFSKPEQVAQGLDIFKLDILDADLNKVSCEYFLIRKKCLLELLSRAKEKGELAKDSDIESLAECLECVWQGTILQWALFKKGKLTEHLRKNLETVLLH